MYHKYCLHTYDLNACILNLNHNKHSHFHEKLGSIWMEEGCGEGPATVSSLSKLKAHSRFLFRGIGEKGKLSSCTKGPEYRCEYQNRFADVLSLNRRPFKVTAVSSVQQASRARRQRRSQTPKSDSEVKRF